MLSLYFTIIFHMLLLLAIFRIMSFSFSFLLYNVSYRSLGKLLTYAMRKDTEKLLPCSDLTNEGKGTCSRPELKHSLKVRIYVMLWNFQVKSSKKHVNACPYVSFKIKSFRIHVLTCVIYLIPFTAYSSYFPLFIARHMVFMVNW